MAEAGIRGCCPGAELFFINRDKRNCKDQMLAFNCQGKAKIVCIMGSKAGRATCVSCVCKDLW